MEHIRLQLRSVFIPNHWGSEILEDFANLDLVHSGAFWNAMNNSYISNICKILYHWGLGHFSEAKFCMAHNNILQATYGMMHSDAFWHTIFILCHWDWVIIFEKISKCCILEHIELQLRPASFSTIGLGHFPEGNNII